ncbi:sodium/potassium/calcium exchanger 1 [Notolabrus celidotus]|uniref:sodium/potassium/calcium exchanger 1 n=1 Tax=Notolabrus celidotus TaxID=1203425 RepID=UPI00149053E0|nr:sodium/potassium/calcium exchanger 1 [Notolabrus celidotus]
MKKLQIPSFHCLQKCVSEDLDCPEGSTNAIIGEDGSDRDLKVCVKNDCDNVNKKKEEEKRDRPLSLDWPDTRLKQATFLFLLPINFPLWLTVPDVRKQKSRKFFVITFLVSILWIAVFSYFMLWWAHQVGETFGISHWIMAVVAAETSIPDLITSVIVVRKGLGDMTVSSSMGRNIFSITVCLPVPWLLNSAFQGFDPVPVNNSGFFCVIGLLLLPLLYAVISIAFCKWKMNKVLGFTMLLFYMIFQLTRVMFQYRIIVCPV